MNTQVNWKKIRTEFNRLSDVDTLKSEVQRIGTEIRNFDYNSVLSPNAQKKVKAFEKRYTTLVRTISQAQRQVDREFNRIVRELQTKRKDVNKTVNAQKAKLEDLKKSFAKKSAATRSAAKGTKKRATKATSTKKRATKKKA